MKAAMILMVALTAGVCLAQAKWEIGTPIVTYYAGPSMTDATAQQMAEGNFNVVWCTESQLDNVQKHGLRGMLRDGLLSPAVLDDDAKRAELDALHDDLYVLACAVEDSERDLAAGDPSPAELRTMLDWLLDAARPLRDREISAPAGPAS